MTTTPPLIRFPQGVFSELRSQLLGEGDRETFALLLGKRTAADGLCVIRVVEIVHPGPKDYCAQSLMALRLKREFVYDQLLRMQERGDVDTVIDVHTHPFCSDGATFSSVDDQDEINFHRWLNDTLDDVGYASIVLSQSDYAARVWEMNAGASVASPARVKTQTAVENWPCSDEKGSDSPERGIDDLQSGFLARSALALGLDTLRQIVSGQKIAIIGVGGLGSVIAENMIHSGFHHIDLIDPDRVEITNLNRIVGAYYTDAMENRLKVDVVKEHLLRINPKSQIGAHAIGVEEDSVLPVLMQCDWLIVATDSHASRYIVQKIALELGIPLISAGVNISVEERVITDMSGEVIIARSGDGLCLNCLGRINPTLVAAEEYKGLHVGDELIRRGYVAGQNVKEPAVKTLNATVGTMATDLLLNQYTQRQEHIAAWVYENNKHPLIYPDQDSVNRRSKNCYFCT